MPGASGLAAFAAAHFVKIPGSELVPIAFDQKSTAAMAPGAAAFCIMDIAGIDIAQAISYGDFAGSGQCRRRRGRGGLIFPGRMIGAEVQRYIRPQLFGDPLAHGRNFFLGIIGPGDEKSGDLEPDFRLPL